MRIEAGLRGRARPTTSRLARMQRLLRHGCRTQSTRSGLSQPAGGTPSDGAGRAPADRAAREGRRGCSAPPPGCGSERSAVSYHSTASAVRPWSPSATARLYAAVGVPGASGEGCAVVRLRLGEPALLVQQAPEVHVRIGVTGRAGEELRVEDAGSRRDAVLEGLGLGEERVHVGSWPPGGGDGATPGRGAPGRNPRRRGPHRRGRRSAAPAASSVSVLTGRLAGCRARACRSASATRAGAMAWSTRRLAFRSRTRSWKVRARAPGRRSRGRALGEPRLDELEHPLLGGAEHRRRIGERVGPRLHLGPLHDGERGTSAV